MTKFRKCAVTAMAVLLVAGGLELGAALGLPGASGVVSEAGAVVGRPVSPVSVAGVGRRTVRRCAAGVYNC